MDNTKTIRIWPANPDPQEFARIIIAYSPNYIPRKKRGEIRVEAKITLFLVISEEVENKSLHPAFVGQILWLDTMVKEGWGKIDESGKYRQDSSILVQCYDETLENFRARTRKTAAKISEEVENAIRLFKLREASLPQDEKIIFTA